MASVCKYVVPKGYGSNPSKDTTLNIDESYKEGSNRPLTRITPYINTIPVESEKKSPGDQNIERRIRSLIRWNAAAMVVKANKKDLLLRLMNHELAYSLEKSYRKVKAKI